MAMIAFRSSIGKDSRNLGDTSSEFIVEIPSYDDIYYERPKSDTDIRIYLEQLLVSDVYAIEALFSTDIVCSNDKVEELVKLRNEIVKLDLFMLYTSIIEKYDEIKSDNKNKFDTIQLTEQYRLLDFIERSIASSFQDFDYVFKYSGMQKETLDRIFNGEISYASAKVMLNTKYRNVLQLKDKWVNFQRNEKLEIQLKELVYSIIKQYHKYELVTSQEFYNIYNGIEV